MMINNKRILTGLEHHQYEHPFDKAALEKLEKIQGFTEWATVVDCHCDTLDDVYSWLFTFEV